MVMNRDLRIRLTKRQHEIIKSNAENAGKGISEFCREKILSPTFQMESSINRIKESVQKIEKLIDNF